MSANKKTIAVTGATGTQGGSVVDIFLRDPDLRAEWDVRGLTRDLNSTKAQALAARGVEVMKADMGDKESLVRAFSGAYAVFAVTDYWAKLDKQNEIEQGKNMADAALEAHVQHLIVSVLDDVQEKTNGELTKVYHFDGKAEIERYTRSLTSLPATFFLPGIFNSNFPGAALRRPSPDQPWTLALPISADTPLPLFDSARDTGKYVKAIVQRRESLLGARVLGVSDQSTPARMMEEFRATFPHDGKDARFTRLPDNEFVAGLEVLKTPRWVAEEMLEMFKWIDGVGKGWGYFGGADESPSLALLGDDATSWVEHMKGSKALEGLK